MTRTEINQANSQHSTGPVTDAGKQRSSQNALRHGLTAQVVVMPSEDLASYKRHLKSFTDEYRPEGASETQLVLVLANASWRLNRVAALETNLLPLVPPELGGAPNEVRDAIAVAAALESHAKSVANLGMHSQRLFRQFDAALVRLRDLQKTRREQETRDLNQVLNVMAMYKSKGETYDPTRDGFVFSSTQIAAGVLARKREILTGSAYLYTNKPA